MRKRGPAGWTIVAGLFGALVVASCHLVGGFDGFRVGEEELGPGGAGGESGGGAGTPGGGGGGAACGLRRPPPLPSEAPPGSAESFTVALRRVELGEDLDAGRLLGYDLDSAYTCASDVSCAAEPECERPPFADGSWARCDGPQGSDANSTELFNSISTFNPELGSSGLSNIIEAGGGSVLFSVRDYNGEANDTDIRVDVFAAGPFARVRCNGDRANPRWDGSDRWPVARTSVITPTDDCRFPHSPTTFDTQAYVSDHRVVARFASLTLFLELEPDLLELTVRDVTVVLPLENNPDTGAWAVRGADLMGRWVVADVFSALGKLGAVQLALCNEVGRQNLRRIVCNTADLFARGRGEGSCDAISFIAQFDADPAQLGATFEPENPAPCPELEDLSCVVP